jgi:hypothetical protein
MIHLTPEDKAELRLWHERMTGPNIRQWWDTQEFRDFSLRFQGLFVRAAERDADERALEAIDFVKQLIAERNAPVVTHE